MHSYTVYHIPCSCGKYYVRNIWILLTRMKEHQMPCGKKSPQLLRGHSSREVTTIIDQARRQKELLVIETLHNIVGWTYVVPELPLSRT